jgi:hypothetical protein
MAARDTVDPTAAASNDTGSAKGATNAKPGRRTEWLPTNGSGARTADKKTVT